MPAPEPSAVKSVAAVTFIGRVKTSSVVVFAAPYSGPINTVFTPSDDSSSPIVTVIAAPNETATRSIYIDAPVTADTSTSQPDKSALFPFTTNPRLATLLVTSVIAIFYFPYIAASA